MDAVYAAATIRRIGRIDFAARRLYSEPERQDLLEFGCHIDEYGYPRRFGLEAK
jgi:hypothetical protein